MLSPIKSFSIIFIISEVLFICVYIFSQGFLLKRDEIHKKSTCNDFREKQTNVSSYCWIPRKFEKAVIMVIDGLRYDFAKYDSLKKEVYFANNLQILEELLSSKENNAILRPFIADPPTTTMQRLKGLTTGSLPTFIDVGNNFESEEIKEDNLIYQFFSLGKKIVFMGDDTWNGLFPNQFHRSFFFPSFNVMDLDTVDNGIIYHLSDELAKPDWDVMILHFLGVDHCGHTYKPSHIKMKEKLQQMDKVIRKIVTTLDNSTVLFVIGDHGMTSSGNHGGDSLNELESAFFLYSPLPNIINGLRKLDFAIPQIDFVPTLSLLLGVPIPYSNLGKVMPELFSSDEASLSHALSMNAQQVFRYLNAYQNKTGDFPQGDWNAFMNSYSNLSHKSSFRDYFNFVQDMCERVWAKFNDIAMLSGLFSLLCGILLILEYLVFKNFFYLALFVVKVNLLFIFSFILSSLANSLLIISSLVLLFILLLKHSSLCLRKENISIHVFIIFSLCVGSFSNSFVVAEDNILSFFIVTQTLLIGIPLLWQSKTGKLSSCFGRFEFILSSCLILMFVCIRLSYLFWVCREEKYWCEQVLNVHTPLNGLAREFHNKRFFTSVIVLVGMILAPYKWLVHCGNLNGTRVAVFFAKIIPVINGFLIAGIWALESVSSYIKNMKYMLLYIPRILYFLNFLFALVIFWKPFLIYVLPKSGSLSPSSTNPNVIIPEIFMKLKKKYDKQNSSDPPIVYGLATCLSAPFIMFLMCIVMVIILISGDGMIPAILLLITKAICCLLLVAFSTWKKAWPKVMFLPESWIGTSLWFLLSLHGFYTTGHQATFSSINWTSGFIGYSGDGSYLFPTFLIGLNTFSSHFLYGLSLPLMTLAPFAIAAMWPSVLKDKNQTEEYRKGEFILVQRGNIVRRKFTSEALIYISIHGIKVLLTSIASFFLRRVLHTWKVFAPHFIFEAVGFGVTCLGVLLGQLFALRILSAMEDWSDDLIEKDQ